MIATVLLVASAAILFSLGTMHLIITFVGPKLTPRDPALQVRMREVSPVITNETTIWNFWIGFNISHSMAAMLFGLIYGFLAIVHGNLLFSSPYLLIVGFLMLVGCFVVGKVYWFSTPVVGIGISLACYVAAVIAALA